MQLCSYQSCVFCYGREMLLKQLPQLTWYVKRYIRTRYVMSITTGLWLNVMQVESAARVPANLNAGGNKINKKHSQSSNLRRGFTFCSWLSVAIAIVNKESFKKSLDPGNL